MRELFFKKTLLAEKRQFLPEVFYKCINLSLFCGFFITQNNAFFFYYKTLYILSQ